MKIQPLKEKKMKKKNNFKGKEHQLYIYSEFRA